MAERRLTEIVKWLRQDLRPYLETQEEVAECLDSYTCAEMDVAQERALIRCAWKFKHLLKPRMQQILEARYTQDGEEKKECREKRRLLLDDLYESEDPKVERTLGAFLKEASETAHERALIRVAWKFKHLLSPRMQEILEAECPQPESE